MNTVVSFSGNGFVFAVVRIGGSFMVAVRKHVAMGSYVVVDVMSCEDEQEARSVAWAMSEPDGYTGV